MVQIDRLVIFSRSGEELALWVTNSNGEFGLPSSCSLSEEIQRTAISLSSRPYAGVKVLSSALIYLEDSEQVVDSTGEWIQLMELEALREYDGAILCEALGHFFRVFHSESEGLAVELPKLFGKGKSHKHFEKLAFYGGSFDPWHDGHAECVRQASKPLVVVPDTNPWKDPYKKEVCCFETLRKIAENLKNNPSVMVYPGFWGLAETNPTSSWLPLVQVDEKIMVIGDDNFLKIREWIHSHTLLDCLSQLEVIPRLASDEDLKRHRESLINDFPKLKIEIRERHQFETLSSTEIRMKLKS